MPLLILINALIQDELDRKGHLNHINSETIQFNSNLSRLVQETERRRALVKAVRSGNLSIIGESFVTH